MVNKFYTEIELQQMRDKMLAYFQSHWKLFLAEGIFLIILGVFAILTPQIFSVVFVVVLGWILLFGGISLIIRCLFVSSIPGFGLWLFMGVLQTVLGFMFIANPIGGELTLTVLLSLVFAIEGVSKIYFALVMRPMAQWGFVLFSGITALFLATIIWLTWPGSANWLLGLFVGINMFFAGWSFVQISLHHKK